MLTGFVPFQQAYAAASWPSTALTEITPPGVRCATATWLCPASAPMTTASPGRASIRAARAIATA